MESRLDRVQYAACQRLALSILTSAVEDVCNAKGPNVSAVKKELAEEALSWMDHPYDTGVITFAHCIGQLGTRLDVQFDDEKITQVCERIANFIWKDPFTLRDRLQSIQYTDDKYHPTAQPVKARTEWWPPYRSLWLPFRKELA